MSEFLSENFHFLVVKVSVYLNRLVFVMTVPDMTHHMPINQQTGQNTRKKGGKRKSMECHSHKPQPFPDTKRKRKQTKQNKRKSNKRTKHIKISFLFPKRGNRNDNKTVKYKNKTT